MVVFLFTSPQCRDIIARITLFQKKVKNKTSKLKLSITLQRPIKFIIKVIVRIINYLLNTLFQINSLLNSLIFYKNELSTVGIAGLVTSGAGLVIGVAGLVTGGAGLVTGGLGRGLSNAVTAVYRQVAVTRKIYLCYK